MDFYIVVKYDILASLDEVTNCSVRFCMYCDNHLAKSVANLPALTRIQDFKSKFTATVSNVSHIRL